MITHGDQRIGILSMIRYKFETNVYIIDEEFLFMKLIR